ncbi:uncharacterized protein B0I36DRAFT_349340 [Microdochium trichocladiopsis]|uniref:Uncharacterized protein n=1 Tax=Microdochium trichocladiopsis TaxID=1682393 RepID=A0A9P8Y4V9_9PEZI|nr:uncharacterized protein B0I36DRAFT_349340 [Microdochium trichocladiopsis]KAH7031237.1 hypothetical protein B0I36DRAFT_349340 [Microdochium trichocladiopsis]
MELYEAEDSPTADMPRLRPCKSFPMDEFSSRAGSDMEALVCGSRHLHSASWIGGDGAMSKPSTTSGFSNTAKTTKTASPTSSVSITPSLRRLASNTSARHSSAGARSSLLNPEHSPPVQERELIVDPPRPAKQGMEWVWYPAGYWAEREIIAQPARERGTRHHRWGRHSSDKTLPTDTHDDALKTLALPLGALRLRALAGSNNTLMPMPSPYMSEETHVQSLQNSDSSNYTTYNRDGGLTGGTGDSFPSDTSSRFPFPLAPLPTPHSTDDQSEPLTSSGAFPMPVVEEHASAEGQSTRTKMVVSPDIVESQPTSNTTSSSTVKKPCSPAAVGKVKNSFIARLRPSRKNSASQSASGHCSDSAKDSKPKKKCSQHDQSSSQTPSIGLARIASILRSEWKVNGRVGSFSLRDFGKSPWHRKTSTGSSASAPSSVREAMRGIVPLSTPAEEIGL